MEQRPSLHLCLIAIEKGAYVWSSTKVTNLTFLVVQQILINQTNAVSTLFPKIVTMSLSVSWFPKKLAG